MAHITPELLKIAISLMFKKLPVKQRKQVSWGNYIWNLTSVFLAIDNAQKVYPGVELVVSISKTSQMAHITPLSPTLIISSNEDELHFSVIVSTLRTCITSFMCAYWRKENTSKECSLEFHLTWRRIHDNMHQIADRTSCVIEQHKLGLHVTIPQIWVASYIT